MRHLILSTLILFLATQNTWAQSSTWQQQFHQAQTQSLALMNEPDSTAPTQSAQAAYQSFMKNQFRQAYSNTVYWAKQGDSRAQLVLGFMYEFGQGTAKASKKAALWYLTAIDRVTDKNLKPLERGLNAYFGQGEKTDYSLAARWFRMAALLNVVVQ